MLVSLRCEPQAADLNTPMATAPQQRHWIAHNTPQQHGDLLCRLPGGSSHSSSREESHLKIEKMSVTVGQGQPSKQTSGTRTFWILQSWETTYSYVNHVWFYDSSLYWLMFFIFLHRGPVKVFVKTPTVYVS